MCERDEKSCLPVAADDDDGDDDGFIYRPDMYNTRDDRNLWRPLAIAREPPNPIGVFMSAARLRPTSGREGNRSVLAAKEFTVHQQWQQMECTHTPIYPLCPVLLISVEINELHNYYLACFFFRFYNYSQVLLFVSLIFIYISTYD
jgi:hypothetical protein